MGRGASLVVSAMLPVLVGLSVPRACLGEAEAIPDSQLGIRTAPLLLLSRADVQEDLGLSRSQVDEAAEAVRSLRSRAAGLRGLKGEKVLEARRAIDADQQLWLEGRLSEAQRKRIVQIDLQWEGPAALVSRPALSELVGLTAEQRVSLRKAVDDAQRRRNGGEDVLAVEAGLTQQALKILTEPQRGRWKSILGPPYHPRLAGAKGARR